MIINALGRVIFLPSVFLKVSFTIEESVKCMWNNKLIIKFLFLFFAFCVNKAYSQQEHSGIVADYSFTDGIVNDNTSNSKLFLRNNAEVVFDNSRAYVLRFKASDKS